MSSSIVRLSQDGRRCLTVFRRNQFKIFDTKSGTILYNHVDKEVSNYTSADWITFTNNDSIKLKSNSSDSNCEKKEYLVLGSSDSGSLQLWDLSADGCQKLGNITVFAEAGNTNVGSDGFAVCGHEERKSVYIGCREVNTVYEICVETRKTKQKFSNKAGVLQLTLTQDRLITASTSKIKSFNLKDGSCMTKSPVPTLYPCTNLATVMSDSKTRILACDGSENISIIELESSNSESSESAFSASLIGEGSVKLDSVNVSEKSIIAVTNDGKSGFRWDTKRVMGLKTSKETMRASEMIIQNKSDKSSGQNILYAQPLNTDDNSIILALGSSGQPRFCTQKFESDSSTSNNTILKKVELPTSTNSNSDDSGMNKRSSALGDPEVKPAKKLKVSAVTTKAGKPGVSGEVTLPMEGDANSKSNNNSNSLNAESLKDVQDHSHTRVQKVLKKIEEDMVKSRTTVTSANYNTGAISLAPMIKQYLKSTDPTMLLSCLVQVDKKVIVKSIKDLTGSEAFEWFKECERLMFREPSKVGLLTEHIKQILTLHVSYLLAHQSLKRTLEPFYQSLEDRLASHDSLLRLQGKLDLLITTANDRIESQKEQTSQLQIPIRTYNEKEMNENDSVNENDNDNDSDNDSTNSNSNMDSDSDGEFDAEELKMMMDDENFDPSMLDGL